MTCRMDDSTTNSGSTLCKKIVFECPKGRKGASSAGYSTHGWALGGHSPPDLRRPGSPSDPFPGPLVGDFVSMTVTLTAAGADSTFPSFALNVNRSASF